MPKESTVKQFRKGTKSCIECRQRKLRCIPSSDENSACQNCQSRGRQCVSQVEVGRTNETTGVTSRDRIRQLEKSVSDLWSVLHQLKNGISPEAQAQLKSLVGDDARAQESHVSMNDIEDGESEITDDSPPLNPPTHLQQLFDNEFLDSKDNDNITESSPSKSMDAAVQRARTRLQALMPRKDDVSLVFATTLNIMSMYNMIFSPFSMFSTTEEMLSKYDELMLSDADPIPVAAFLMWTAIAVHHAAWEDIGKRIASIEEPNAFVRQVSDTVEKVLVSNDNLAGSLEGIETSMLWIRLQMFRADVKKMWLALRRFIALAELAGLPRASYQHANFEPRSDPFSPSTINSSRTGAAAAVWENICVIDRLVGMMFNLPLGTLSYGFPSQQAVVLNGRVHPRHYLGRLSRLATIVQEIDNLYASRRPDTELFEKVFQADQDLRSLRASTPEHWWNLSPESTLPDHLMQYWHFYFTARAHLQLALRNSPDSQGAYSYLACTKACRAAAIRYIRLRSLLPPAFFAGRMLDLQAMTVAVFLLYTSYSPSTKPGVNFQDETDMASDQLVQQIVQIMESVSNKAGGQFARQEAKAIRRLSELLSQRDTLDSSSLSLRIPMLGKIHVGRHSNGQQNVAGGVAQNLYQQQPNGNNMPGQADPQQPTYVPTGMEQQDPLSWSMDLMLEDFPPFSDDVFDTNQWLSFNEFTQMPQA